MLFTGLLKFIHHAFLINCITVLTEACRFLWIDYNEYVPYWDIVDIIRKVFLTGFIMFLDPQEGSTKFSRLILATEVSIVYLSILYFPVSLDSKMTSN